MSENTDPKTNEGNAMPEMGNVLVLGNSGVGKSTLINAILGEKRAKTSYGTKGTSDHLEVYENETLPFRLVDSIGFVPMRAIWEPIFGNPSINAVRQWCSDSVSDAHAEKRISMIWFCVDGCASKLFDQTISDLINATNIFKRIPIMVVITKSYSAIERQKNLDMVRDSLHKHEKIAARVRGVFPVVAEAYPITEEVSAPVDGIKELVEKTAELMPEAFILAQEDIDSAKLDRKRAMAYGAVGIAAASAAVVGAVPLPFADAAILVPIETAEVNGIARIYGIKNDEETKLLLNSIIEVGTVSTAAKLAISALKAIPMVNLAAIPLNAIIAACIAAGMGVGAAGVFEQIYLGKIKPDEINVIQKLMEEYLSNEFLKKAGEALQAAASEGGKLNIAQLVMKIFATDKGAK